MKTISGKVKFANGMISSWILEPDSTLKVTGLVINKFSAESITHSGQVVRMIDDGISDVKEYQVENGEWEKYR